LVYLAEFATSLAIGSIIGLEREHNPAAKAGLRTFALVTNFSMLAAMLSYKAFTPWLLISGLLLVGFMMIASQCYFILKLNCRVFPKILGGGI
jgi:hypothetical protein